MSDDSDFTAPCGVVTMAGRCLMQAHWVDDVVQPHEHRFPPPSAVSILVALAERLREKATHGKGGYPDTQTLAVAEAFEEVLKVYLPPAQATPDLGTTEPKAKD